MPRSCSSNLLGVFLINLRSGEMGVTLELELGVKLGFLSSAPPMAICPRGAWLTLSREPRFEKVVETSAAEGRSPGTLLQHFSRSPQTRSSILPESRTGTSPARTTESTSLSL